MPREAACRQPLLPPASQAAPLFRSTPYHKQHRLSPRPASRGIFLSKKTLAICRRLCYPHTVLVNFMSYLKIIFYENY
ncbi:MAG: hypothetical protein BHW56_03495 [Acetobacter sp. 46_36]|nr:MAG: hypothetical protein BHW56_03495 [Acetobacter sp. 46_36]